MDAFIRPSDQEMELSRLIYVGIELNSELTPELPEWARTIELGYSIHQSFALALRDAAEGYGVDPALIVVQRVNRPPFVEPLISSFFINLDPLVQAVFINVAASAAWDGFKRGVKAIREVLHHVLSAQRLPEKSLRLRFSPAELEDLCVAYVKDCWHPRAKMSVSRDAFNTTYEGGYAFLADLTMPMG